MKSAIYPKAVLVISTLLFSILVCYGQEGSPDSVVGTWTKELSERTISFTINSDGKYQVEFTGDSETDVLGSYVVSENKIFFTDEGGEYMADVTGEYDFSVNESSITFTLIDDPVSGRQMLVEGTWSKAADAEK